MTRDAVVTEGELHAYADGRLPPDETARVEGWLNRHPEDAKRVALLRMMNGRIRELYSRAGEPVPDRLRPSAIAARQRRSRWRILAACLAMFLFGGAGGWLAKGYLASDPQPSVRLADEGIGAHKIYAPEVRHPVEVPGDERQHLETWLSKRLGHRISIPDLSQVGYRLVGGRLLANFNEPRAMFLYEAPNGQRLTVYAGRNPLSREVSFRFHRSGDVGAICWLDEARGYAVVAEADESTLLRLAHFVLDQAEPVTLQ